MCYTYDSLNRVISRVIKNISDNSVISTETFTYDAAGNVTDAPDSCFQYDTNNRLVVFNGNSVSYDLDGNMLNNGVKNFTYDSANRLITADGHTYTYNAEDVRIRNLCSTEDTTYTYDTNCRLSKLLTKTTGGVVTKYVYGRGLIGEEVSNAFKTYHFDCRGSTIAITDASGNITDTFAYDTYGKLISRTGTSKIIFGYNGRDGVVTDDNGLIYMRARYYSPEMKRFINADIVAGAISNAITLNRFAYANGNPVSFVDPFGLSAERCMQAVASAVVPAYKFFLNVISKFQQNVTDSNKDLPYFDYKDYKELIKKALQKTQKKIYDYHARYGGYQEVVTGFDDAYTKILSAMENDTIPEAFLDDVKVAIYINPNYNTSGEEILGEIIGFVPYLGELYGFVDYMSNENKNFSTLFNSIFTLFTEEDIAGMTKYAKELDLLGKIVTLYGIYELIESIENQNSHSKITTSLTVCVDVGENDIYRYTVLVDPNLMFKERYSDISAKEIEGSSFQLVVGE